MSTFHPKHEKHQEQSKKAQYVIKTDNTRQNTSQHNSIHISQKARNTTQQNIQEYPHLIRTQNIKKNTSHRNRQHKTDHNRNKTKVVTLSTCLRHNKKHKNIYKNKKKHNCEKKDVRGSICREKKPCIVHLIMSHS